MVKVTTRQRFARRAVAVIAVALPSAALGADGGPTTAPTTAPTPASDAAEVRRLDDVGLPSRAFLVSAYADHAAAWRAADAAGNGDAGMLLGICLRDGIGEPADPAKAVAQLGVAAHHGSAYADALLSLITSTGHGTRRDDDAAAGFARRGAKAGDPTAMVYLSIFCERGQGTAKDTDGALKLTQRAIEAGSRLGLIRLAALYRGGVGMAADASMAVQCVRRASDAGSAPATVELGDLCVAGGTGGPAAGAAWYRRAADMGSPLAMLRLGGLYLGDRLGPRDLPQGVDWIRKAAFTGDPDSLVMLGEIYERGMAGAVQRNPSTAFTMFRRSANNGGYGALAKLGICYLYGIGTKLDVPRARRCFQRGAEAEDRACMSELGASYFPSIRGGDPDPALAFRWSKRAAELGDAAAMNRVGVCYVKGIGVMADPAEALRWFHLGADAGNPEAMNSVGLRYHRGEAVPKDQKEAVRWFDMASRYGNANGMHNLGDCFASGDGVPVDGRKAESLYLAALPRLQADGNAREVAAVEFELCALYLNPKAGVTDGAKAIDFARRAAALGDPRGWACLAKAALDGTGLPKDPVAAYGYYKSGAEANDLVAMCGLGMCLQQGIGCEMDQGAAGVWYVKAANAGSTDAMVRAGLLYWQGHPTDEEYQRAADWFRRATDKGDAAGAGELSLLTAFGLGMPQDPEGALALARKAEAGGHPEFLGRLANAYLDGAHAVPKDAARGTALLREAADHGDAASKARLAGTAPPASQPSAALVPLKSPGS